MFRAQVFITLKPVVNDPEGSTILGGLRALGFDSVQDVRAGKYLVLTLAESDRSRAQAVVEEMSQKLLANAVIEDFRIDLQPIAEGEPAPAGARQE